MYIVAIIFGVLAIVGSVFGWVALPNIWWVWVIQILMECVYIYFAIMARQAGINKKDIQELEKRIDEQNTVIAILMGDDLEGLDDEPLVVRNEKYLKYVKSLPVIRMRVGMFVKFRFDHPDSAGRREFVVPKGTVGIIRDIQGDEYTIEFNYDGETYQSNVLVDE